MKNLNIFVENINMETQTVFLANGDINIYPCEFEQGQQIVPGGTSVSQKGRMITHDDGTSIFKHYRTNSGSRYNILFETPHGKIKESASSVVCEIRFPKRYGKDLIAKLHAEESEKMNAFIMTRTTNTEWK